MYKLLLLCLIGIFSLTACDAGSDASSVAESESTSITADPKEPADIAADKTNAEEVEDPASNAAESGIVPPDEAMQAEGEEEPTIEEEETEKTEE